MSGVSPQEVASTFWNIQFKDIINFAILLVTCWAVYIGPLRAVRLARKEENHALKAQKKAEIFATLMRTRNLQLAPEHVFALNLIQVYFHDADKVLSAHKAYIKMFFGGLDLARPEVAKDKDDKFVELVYEIAVELGFKHDKKELQDLAYSPVGWANDELTLAKLRHLMIELLENKRGLAVTPLVSRATESPFPPPPPREG